MQGQRTSIWGVGDHPIPPGPPLEEHSAIPPTGKGEFALPHPLQIDCVVLKPRALRVASVALLLGAALCEPAWEIGHAVAHAETPHDLHEAWEPAPDAARPGVPAVLPFAEHGGHGHPVFQAPVRPFAGPLVAVAALSASIAVLPLEDVAVRLPSFSSVSARASPPKGGTPQPRAPPLT